VQLDGARALAWRLDRHGLGRAAEESVVGVASRVLAIRGWPLHLAELAVGVRRPAHQQGDLEAALHRGELLRAYAFRGGSYVMTHAVAAAVLAVRRTTRVWESNRYQQQGSFELSDWEPWRAAVRDALAHGPATRTEIWAHVRHDPALRHLEDGATGAGSDSLFKPLHWWGDICFGPDRDGHSTFRLLDGDPRWTGTLELDEAGPRAVRDYLAAYGPATTANLSYWLTEGLSAPRRRVEAWLDALANEVTAVDVDGVPAFALTSDLDALSTAQPDDAVLLVPGFDPWVNGPGTADPLVVPPARRAAATRGNNLVLRGGVVGGTWRAKGSRLEVEWFDEADPVSPAAFEETVSRLAGLVGRDLAVHTDR